MEVLNKDHLLDFLASTALLVVSIGRARGGTGALPLRALSLHHLRIEDLIECLILLETLLSHSCVLISLRLPALRLLLLKLKRLLLLYLTHSWRLLDVWHSVQVFLHLSADRVEPTHDSTLESHPLTNSLGRLPAIAPFTV